MNTNNNIVIKKDQVNFAELIKTSNPETSLSFQSRMVQELSNEFSTEQQKWFVANLYMYLNYHQTDDYPIDLDNVWRLIGFSTKGNAKKKLNNNFTVGEDYKITLIQLDKQVHGGHNEEKLMLNVDTFKNLCIMSATKKSKDIRKYYIKLEGIYNKVVNQDYQTYQNQL
jgi:phage anti-repressor protein